MGIKDRLKTLTKKDPEPPELSPSETVSREAERIEQEIVEDLLSTGIRNILFPPFQLESIRYDPKANSYRVKLRGVGTSDDRKMHYVTTFLGSIPREHVWEKATSVADWNSYMRIVVNGWISSMTDDLHKRGATKLLTGPRQSPQTRTVQQAMKEATKSMNHVNLNLHGTATKFSEMIRAAKVYEAGYDKPWILGEEPEDPGPSAGELWEVEESIKQSARRQKPSKDSA